jgi:mannan endo-1,4-beta-mannosidase
VTLRRLGALALITVLVLASCSSSGSKPAATPSTAASTTVAPPKRVAAEPGKFSVDGTTITGPDGQPFVPVGANMLGPESFWATSTIGLSGTAKQWGFNTIRLNTCLPGGCDGLGAAWPINDDLDAIVREYTAAGLVVMIEMHQVKPGAFPEGAELERIKRWWTDVASRFAGNPYVWFNLLNEPGEGQPAPAAWFDVHRSLIDAVRGTGANNIIVLDGTQFGQDAGTYDAGPVPTENSAILTYGPQLAADTGNLVFSVHTYDQFGVPGTDAERDARLGGLLDRIHAASLAVLIGEAGGSTDTADARTLGALTAFRVAPPRGVGILAWHAQPGDEFFLTGSGPFDAIDNDTAPTNLTPIGDALWNLGTPNRHP